MKKVKVLSAIVLAFALAFTIPTIIPQARVVAEAATLKLNKTKVTIYAEQTVQLTLKNAKSVTWKTSNKKVATVTSKGKVKGIKAGSATITATDKKTKKSYKCKITVKALKSFGLKKKDVYLFTGGTVIAYDAAEIKGATYVLDGKKLGKKDYSIWEDSNDDGPYTALDLTTKLSEGKHTFSIQKTGYKTFTVTLTFEALKVNGMYAYEPWAEDGTLYLCCTPDLDGKTYTITVDGTEVQPSEVIGINGDGVYVIWVDVSNLSAGSHTVTVTADGITDGTATFEI